MDMLFIILPLALIIAVFAVAAFIWAARSGQYDDLDTPGRRMLLDDVPVSPERRREVGQESAEAEAQQDSEPGSKPSD